MTREVDSYRYLDFFTRRIVRAWIARESPGPVPWTPLPRPLRESTIALLSTAAIRSADDAPFDQEGERRDPWWGDPTFRFVPRDATERDIRIDHLHVDPRFALRDLNCAFPLGRLLEQERAGFIGRSAPTHYSTMGYILRPRALLRQSVPAMIARMRSEQVDAVLLVPF